MLSMRGCGLLIISAPLILLAACHSHPSPEETAKKLETIASWAATAHWVGEAWESEAVPTAYAKQTLLTAQHKLEEERTSPQLRPTPTGLRPELLDHLQKLTDAIGQMRAAVAQGNRVLLTQQMGQLRGEWQAIRPSARDGQVQP